MTPRPRKGMLGVSGLDQAMQSDEQAVEERAPSKSQKRNPRAQSFRGKNRAPGSTLKTLSVTLPADLIRMADSYVLEQKQAASGYNRSALLEEALKSFLKSR